MMRVEERPRAPHCTTALALPLAFGSRATSLTTLDTCPIASLFRSHSSRISHTARIASPPLPTVGGSGQTHPPQERCRSAAVHSVPPRASATAQAAALVRLHVKRV